MSKLTRLQRSQNAHYDLKRKHADTPGKRGDVLYRYHNNILNIQKAKKMLDDGIITDEEFAEIKAKLIAQL